MSQIEHTLTAEHYGKIEKQYQRWWLDEDSDDERSFAETAIANPLTLTFELPSPWRTDIENAPKDYTEILISVSIGGRSFKEPARWVRELLIWSGSSGEYEDHEITAWMEIPALPERI